ncbi:hypothetical protein [Sphingobacterium gobiense]|uniref:Lipocalin-like domain-containing protein n=1 Tax=Sphingobacterium gobiense TaxID=1382456 RepID=A0A2S9JND4_9SPHI|nr:hypothetical protein [Sphingobacterium gobiense]PRD54509.1 hypothetical protein C5749_13750 [Sphingobacterium gobiense]
MNRDILVKLNYLLLALLLIGASLVIRHAENPERLIQGQWVEKEWRLEKDNAGADEESQIQSGLKKEILRNVEDLHLGVWHFSEDGSLKSASSAEGSNMEWFIKGRGHVLELRRDGKPIESFQIQQINRDRLVLHLNFDLQVKGIIEIVLEKKEQLDQYAKKI